MISKASNVSTILDEKFATIDVLDTPYGCKLLWLGIKAYSFTPGEIDILAYILVECLRTTTTPIILYFEHLTEKNADVPGINSMKQIALTVIGSNNYVKKWVKLVIFHPKKVDKLTKAGFDLLSTFHTVKNLFVSDDLVEIETFVDTHFNVIKENKV